MQTLDIKQLNLDDVSHLGPVVKYCDGEIGFADDIRSVMHLSKVFKVNFAAMVFCVRGSISLCVNSKRYDINANDGLLIDMKSVVSDISHDDEMSCKIICISLESGMSFLNKSVLEVFLKFRENPVVSFSEQELDLMSKYYELAMFKIDNPHIGSSDKESMRTILRAYVYDMIAIIRQQKMDLEVSETIMRQSDKIFGRFVFMLANDNGRNRSVRYFANMLCVSPKYLTSICRKTEGLTAGEMITMNATNHIKQMLLYSHLSIKEIAVELGFDNLSFFGKYVKKHLGMSPSSYRKTNGYGM